MSREEMASTGLSEKLLPGNPLISLLQLQRGESGNWLSSESLYHFTSWPGSSL